MICVKFGEKWPSGSEEYVLVERQITDNVLIMMTKAHPNTTKTLPIMIESNNIHIKSTPYDKTHYST